MSSKESARLFDGTLHLPDGLDHEYRVAAESTVDHEPITIGPSLSGHPFVQIGPFIKVALYWQWAAWYRTWDEARIGTIYGLRFGKYGFGVTFRHRIPRGLVRFGAVRPRHSTDGRPV